MTGINRPAVLVTGATGQIGQALVKRLLADAHPVVALRHKRRIPDRADGLTWVDGDLGADRLDLDAPNVARAVHATGIWLLPRHLPAMRAIGVRRLVAFGSTSIFGKAESRSRFEQKLVADIREAEREVIDRCAKLDIAWTILRPTLTYGAGVDKNVSAAARFILRFGFYPVSGPASGRRQPVHADDLALASLQALDAPGAAGKAYDLGGAEILPYREMIGRVFDVLGRRRRLVPVPLLGQLAGAWGRLSGNRVLTSEVAHRMNQDLVFDTAEAARDFAYAPRKFLANGRADLGM